MKILLKFLCKKISCTAGCEFDIEVIIQFSFMDISHTNVIILYYYIHLLVYLLKLARSLMRYFRERKLLLNTIYTLFCSVYFSLCTIEKLTENTLFEKNFRNSGAIADCILKDYLLKKEKVLFDSFVSILKEIINEFSKYEQNIQYLKEIIYKIMVGISEDDILKNINKLHEDLHKLLTELDVSLTKLSKNCKFKTDWTTAKKIIEDILKNKQ